MNKVSLMYRAKSRNRFKLMLKIIGFLISASLLLVIAYLSAVAIDDGPVTMYRMLTSGDSNINTFKIFPYRTISTANAASTIKWSKTPRLPQSLSFSANGQHYDTSVQNLLSQTDTHALVVIRNNSLVYENYLNGSSRDSLFTSFSIAKSVTSALIGIAISEGKITSVNDRIIKYLPELQGRGFDELTIRDMLLMSSGISFRHDDGIFPLFLPFLSDDAKQYYTANLRQLVLHTHKSSEPIGATFHYNDYYSILEGLILERVNGEYVSQLLENKLWKPMGMEYAASWSLDSTTDGLEKTNSAFNARAIDFARFGLLYLNDGYWNGKQIISRQWVSASTTPDPTDKRTWKDDPSWEKAGGYYKYHWWGLRNTNGTYDYLALGKYNQIIYVSPATETVIVRLGAGDQSYPWTAALHALCRSF